MLTGPDILPFASVTPNRPSIIIRLGFILSLLFIFMVPIRLMASEPMELLEKTHVISPRLETFVHSPVSIGFTVALDSDAPMPDDPIPLILCVPQDRALTLRLTSYRVNGVERVNDIPTLANVLTTTETISNARQPVAGGTELLSLVRLGLMRRWPVAAVRIGESFYKPLMEQAELINGVRPSLRARLEITWDEPMTLHPVAPPEKHWDAIAQRLVANPEGLVRYGLNEIPLNEEIKPAREWAWTKQSDRPWVRVRVAEEGLHRLAVEEIGGAEWGEAARHRERVRLYLHGEELPVILDPTGRIYFWNPAATGMYSAENVIWATVDDAQNSSRIPLWTPPAGDTARRTLGETRRSLLLEEDTEHRVSYGDFREVKAMRWVWEYLEAATPIQIPIQLEDAIIRDGSVEIEIAFYFMLSVMAHSPASTTGVTVTVRQDDGTTQSLTFANDLDSTHTITLNPASFRDGMTTLTIQLDQELVNPDLAELWLDWVRVDYAATPMLRGGRLTLASDDLSTASQILRAPIAGESAIDSSGVIAVLVDSEGAATATLALNQDPDGLYAHWPHDPGARVELYEPSAVPVARNFEMVAAEPVHQDEQGCDLLIITHHEFLEDVEPLAEFRRSQGLRVRVVDVQGAYDAFNYGGLSPYAVRDFVGHAMSQWSGGAPEAILLAGDCSSDYRNTSRQPMTEAELQQLIAEGRNQNHSKGLIKNWVPSHAYDVGSDKWASDEWMGLVCGNDAMSDVMLGRISANNRRDMKRIVEKIIYYETQYPVGPWRAREGLVADNEPEFPESLDRLQRTDMPRAFESPRVYASELPSVDNFYVSDDERRAMFDEERRWMKVSVEATARMLDLFRSGSATVTYFGHGSPNIWSDERIWFGGDSVNSDNQYVAGSGYMPFIINFTCNSGAIDYPVPLWNINIIEDMIRTERGGAIGAFVPSGPGTTWIQQKLGRIIFGLMHRDGVRSLGEFSTLTRLRFASTGLDPNYVYMYILLGDPFQRLQMTENVRRFEIEPRVRTPGERLSGAIDLGPGMKSANVNFSLTNARGDALWNSDPTSASQGLASFDIPLNEAWPSGAMALRMYAWDGKTRRDLAAWGEIQLARSDEQLTTARLWMIDADVAQIEASLANPSPIPSASGRLVVSYVLPDGSLVSAHEEAIQLAANGESKITRRIRVSPEANAMQVALHRARPSDDPARDEPGRWSLPIPGREPVAEAPARLRFVPDSLRIDPESPAEGHTIFVHATVENVGGKMAQAHNLTLHESDPSVEKKPGYDHNQGLDPRNAIPALGAGRQHEMQIRWDPTFNSGDKSFWLQLSPMDVAASPTVGDEITSATIHVRTKFNLSYRNVGVAPVTQEDVDQNRMTLRAEVVNDGESEVRHVMVAFYRGAKTDEAHLIHEQEIPVLGALSAIPIEYAWNFGSKENLSDEDGVRGFRVQLRIKGSRMRITSPPPGAPAAQ